MDCKIYLGSICIMLEDLGFHLREPEDDISSMTYCYYKYIYEKIFADINHDWMLEVCLMPEKIYLDRWHKNPIGLFIVDDELTYDLRDPHSIDKVSDFVITSVRVAND